jgi:hypothetical protein
MVMVVTDTIFEARRRARRLDAPDEPFGGQQIERVVDRLQRDRADLGPHGVSHVPSRGVRQIRDGAQHGQSLRGDLDAVLAKEIGGIGRHRKRLDQTFELFKINSA